MASPHGWSDAVRAWRPGRELVLSGMRWADWLALLAACRADGIPWPYWPRVLRLTVQSALNEGMARLEERAMAAQPSPPEVADPIFLLGCWRSGTTWLHGLLAERLDGVAAPTSLQVLCPHTFLFLEGRLPGLSAPKRLGRRLYDLWIALHWGQPSSQSWRRASDLVSVGLHHPAEDEFAMLMAGRSDLLGHLLGPQAAERAARYLTLNRLSAAELADWEERWLGFLSKLTRRYPGQRLLLKSPQHSARLPWLTARFPQAHYLFVHRHPCDLFRSLRHHLWSVEQVSERLQRRRLEATEQALQLGEQLLDSYLRNRVRLDSRWLLELPYDALRQDPEGQLQRVAAFLGRPLHPAPPGPAPSPRRPLPPLSTEERDLVFRRWGRFFEAFGYPPP